MTRRSELHAGLSEAAEVRGVSACAGRAPLDGGEAGAGNGGATRRGRVLLHVDGFLAAKAVEMALRDMGLCAVLQGHEISLEGSAGDGRCTEIGIVDLGPGDGARIEAARHLRGRCPVLLITTGEETVPADLCGCAAVEKPFACEQLMSSLRSLIEGGCTCG